MALFLLALAAWLGVRSADCQSRARTALLVTAGVTLAAADAMKYATALFTPVVLDRRGPGGMAAARGRGAWLAALLTVLCSWLALIVAAIAAGGRDYWLGITTSTLARPRSDVPVTTVLRSAYVWTSLILVLAVLGAVLASRGEARGKLLPAVLAAAALLVPAEQARLHTTVSLQKHVVFGAWFAAIAAGYAMARLSRVDPGRGWARGHGAAHSRVHAVRLDGTGGRAVQGLAERRRCGQRPALGDPLPSGPLPGGRLRRRGLLPARRSSLAAMVEHLLLQLPGRLPGAPSYAAAISSHYFSLVILDFGDTAATDTQITADMRHAGGYYVLAHAGQFTIWASRAPSRPSGGDHGRH